MTGSEDRHFPAIRGEAERNDVDVTDPESFLRLEAVAALIEELMPEADAQERRGARMSKAQARRGRGLLEYGALVFQAFHFWAAGRPCFVLTEAAARALTEAGEAVGDWTFVAPERSGYLQLPRHLFWCDAGGVAPEPVDGLHWLHSDPDARLRLVLVLGARADRPGVTVVEIDSPLPPPPSRHWADTAARDEGNDFENILPGGELSDLRAIATRGEALKLLSRCFRQLVEHPKSLGPIRQGPLTDEPGTAESSVAKSSATRLPYRVIAPPHATDRSDDVEDGRGD